MLPGEENGIHSSGKGAHHILTRHTIILGNMFLSRPTLKEEDDAAAEKTNLQFRYFRETFITLAAASGVPVPLGITEDPHARLFTFVRHDGPKYILDTLTTHTENVALLRCGLSLLIVTVSILINKLALELVATTNHPTTSTSDSNKFSQALYQIQRDKRRGLTEGEWAAKALHHLCELGAVSSITNVLTATVVQGIQEQCISFLALLVSVSEDAAQHLLAPPNSILTVGGTDTPQGAAGSNSANGAAGAAGGAVAAAPGASDSGASGAGQAGAGAGIGAAGAAGAGVGAAPASSSSARPQSKSGSRAPTMLETTLRNASASTQSFPMLAKQLGIRVDVDAKGNSTGFASKAERRRHPAPGALSSAIESNPNAPPASAASNRGGASCLSFVLTVVAQQKNAHVLIAGFAECIAHMCLKVAEIPLSDLQHYDDPHAGSHKSTQLMHAQSTHMHQPVMQPTEVEHINEALCLAVAQTKTTTLPPRGAHSSASSKKAKPTYKESEKDKDKEKKEALSATSASPAHGHSGGEKADSAPVVAWASLRIFLRFLARNFRYRVDNAALNYAQIEQAQSDRRDAVREARGQSSLREAGDDNNQRNFENLESFGPRSKEDNAESRSRMSAQQRSSFRFAYEKVILALSRLIIGSTAVRLQVLQLKGAVDLYRQSVRGLIDPGLKALSLQAIERLKLEKRALKKERNDRTAHNVSTKAAVTDRRPSSRPGSNQNSRPSSRSANGLATDGMAAADTGFQGALNGTSLALSSISHGDAPFIQDDGQKNSQKAGATPSSTGADLQTFGSIGSLVGSLEKGVMRGAQEMGYGGRSLGQGFGTEMGGESSGRVRTAGTGTRSKRGKPSSAAANAKRGDTQNRPSTAPAPAPSPFSPVLYYMPESPQRRGLSPQHQSRDDATSLHRSVFGYLPVLPNMPSRIAADEALTWVENLPSSQQTSGFKVLKAVTDQAVGTLTWEGYTRNGKHSVPILERARRAYLPKRPSTEPAGEVTAFLEDTPVSVDDVRESSQIQSQSLSQPQSQSQSQAAQSKSAKRSTKKQSAPPAADEPGYDPEDYSRYSSLGLGVDISFDEPELMQSFRPIYEIDLGPDAGGSVMSEEAFANYAAQVPPGDRKARHGLLTNADLLFSL